MRRQRCDPLGLPASRIENLIAAQHEERLKSEERLRWEEKERQNTVEQLRIMDEDKQRHQAEGSLRREEERIKQLSEYVQLETNEKMRMLSIRETQVKTIKN